MVTYFQAIILGLLQGITELFPISSLGHSVILPKIFGWNINQSDPFFLTFLVATHLATAVVLFLFFWKDWLAILKGMGRSLAKRTIEKNDYHARLGWLLVVGTIPAGIVGLLLQDKLQILFSSAKIAAIFLIGNGVLLYGAELLRRRAPTDRAITKADVRIAKTSWMQSLLVGVCQSIALLPGFSRSGSTMAGGLLIGLSHEDAARFSFLLATPIIGGAAVFKLLDFLAAPNYAAIGPAVVGALCAAFGAYFSVKFLLKYFETNKLTPFAVYCFVAGIVYSVILFVR